MSKKTNPVIVRRLKRFDSFSFQHQPYGKTYIPYALNEQEQITQYVQNFMQHLGVILHSMKFLKTPAGKNFFIIRYISMENTKTKKPTRLNFLELETAFAYGICKILKNEQVNVSFINVLKLQTEETNSLPLKFFKNWKLLTQPEIRNAVELILCNYGCASFLAQFIALKMSSLRSKTNKKSQAQLLIVIKTLIHYIKNNAKVNVEGIKIIIKGRINGIPRTKKWVFFEGVLSLQQVEKDIDYYFMPSFTVFGVFGVKVWINYGKKKC